MSSLTNALDQWNNNKKLNIFYNSFHIVAIEPIYEIHPIKPCYRGSWTPKYLPLESYGTYHFIASWKLSKKYLKLLGEYFNYKNPNVNIM